MVTSQVINKQMKSILLAVAVVCASASDTRNNGVDIEMDVPELEGSMSLPFELKGVCHGGRKLSLEMTGKSALPQNLKLIVAGELDMLHHSHISKLHSKNSATSATWDVDLPDWSVRPENYVSIHVIDDADNSLQARWEFVKMAELCGLVSLNAHASDHHEVSFDGNLPSHKPKGTSEGDL